MKRSYALVAALAIFLAVPAAKAEAQVSFGPQAVLVEFEDFGIGARVDLGLGQAFGMVDGPLQGLFASLNGSYMFIDSDVTSLLFNANLGIPFALDGPLTPYVGAGLNHNRVSVDTGAGSVSGSNSGLNLLGGVFLGLGGLPAFAEVQYSTTGDGYVTVSLGFLFGR